MRPGKLVAIALGLAWLVTGCASSSSSQTATGQNGAGLQGLIVTPRTPAPALRLRDYSGRPVSLAALRGRAVLVTFVYTHCPDVCPLIVSGLAAAQRGLGREASRVRILAVTVDPRHDTPAAVRGFLRARGALGRMDYLVGSDGQLLGIWRAWHVAVNIGRRRVSAGHSSLVYGITASGRVAVIYPSNFIPQEIIHDVPLLAAA